MAFRMQVQCLTIYAYIYNLNANGYVNQTLPFDKIPIVLNAFVIYYLILFFFAITVKLMKGKALNKHSLHEKKQQPRFY